jgi:hypothetical protein
MKKKHENIESFLEQGEEFLWTGRPRQGLIFRSSDYYFIPLSLIFTAVTCWGLILFSSWDNIPSFMIIVFLPFIIASFHLLIFRFINDIERRKSTIYGLTNKKAIIFNTKSKNFITIDLSNVKFTKIIDTKESNGTLVLANKIIGAPLVLNDNLSLKYHRYFAFEFIENPQAILKTITDLK